MARRAVLAVVAAMVVAAVSLGAAEKGMFEGRPEFKEGRELGYYVWVDGDTWHVRWTTMGGQRRFAGQVTGEGGDLKSLKRVDVEEESRLVRAGRAPRVVRGPRGRVRGVAPGRTAVVATKEEDKIAMDGDRRIVFTSKNDGDIDGFSFKVADNVRHLRFALEVDGKSRPADVEVGRSNRQPGGNPCVVDKR
jgi:hypothetical protein